MRLTKLIAMGKAIMVEKLSTKHDKAFKGLLINNICTELLPSKNEEVLELYKANISDLPEIVSGDIDAMYFALFDYIEEELNKIYDKLVIA